MARRQNDPNLETAFAWFNRELFGDELPKCALTFQRARRARGYFWPEVVRVRRKKRCMDEIALNPDSFPGRKDGEVMSTLVHEMVHLWQAHFGEPGRRGYHNKQWAAKMEEVGLIPSDTGRPGGKRTGERVSHFIKSGGPFAVAWGELYRTGFRLEWETIRRPNDEAKNKVKYACPEPECKLAVWGKPSLEGMIICAEHGLPLE